MAARQTTELSPLDLVTDKNARIRFRIDLIQITISVYGSRSSKRP